MILRGLLYAVTLTCLCLVLDGTGGKVKLTMFSSRWYWWKGLR